MTNQAKLTTIVFAALLALALQAGQVSAFDSPVPQPPPPRPTPPAYVEPAPTWHTQADASHHLERHDRRARHDQSESSADVTSLIDSTPQPSSASLTSVDVVGWLWVVAVEK